MVTVKLALSCNSAAVLVPKIQATMANALLQPQKELRALEFEDQNQLKTSSAVFYTVTEELSLIDQHLQEQHTPTHNPAQ